MARRHGPSRRFAKNDASRAGKSLPIKPASGALHPSAKKRSVPVGRPIPCATAPAAANGPGATPAASKPAARPRRVYQTNHYVEVQGEFKPHGGHLLIIDGIPIPLQLIQFVTIFLLACHALTLAGRPTPMQIEVGDYLSASKIESLIKQLKTEYPGLSGCLEIVTPGLIFNAKLSILGRIREQGKDPSLIKSLYGVGYFLSTPPERIRIKLITSTGVRVWDWRR